MFSIHGKYKIFELALSSLHKTYIIKSKKHGIIGKMTKSGCPLCDDPAEWGINPMPVTGVLFHRNGNRLRGPTLLFRQRRAASAPERADGQNNIPSDGCLWYNKQNPR